MFSLLAFENERFSFKFPSLYDFAAQLVRSLKDTPTERATNL